MALKKQASMWQEGLWEDHMAGKHGSLQNLMVAGLKPMSVRRTQDPHLQSHKEMNPNNLNELGRIFFPRQVTGRKYRLVDILATGF